jgi:hypothetical protein
MEQTLEPVRDAGAERRAVVIRRAIALTPDNAHRIRLLESLGILLLLV